MDALFKRVFNGKADNNNVKLSFLILFCIVSFTLPAQDVLRGEIKVELEPIYGGFIEDKYPLDADSAYRRALEEASMFFSAQIYGWSFYYDIGERARGIAEEFELTPLGEIPWGDPALYVTHASHDRNKNILSVWMDYRPDEAQRYHLEMWQKGNVRTAQALGHGPWGNPVVISDWLSIKKEALEDAARAAVRTMLQASERNRPKEVTGLISLEGFPAYWIDAGRWVARARFKIEISEIIPFAAY
jgi:hypothetical protein